MHLHVIYSTKKPQSMWLISLLALLTHFPHGRTESILCKQPNIIFTHTPGAFAVNQRLHAVSSVCTLYMYLYICTRYRNVDRFCWKLGAMANLQMFRFVFCLLKIVMSEPQWFQRARMKWVVDEIVLTGLDQISYVALFGNHLFTYYGYSKGNRIL